MRERTNKRKILLSLALLAPIMILLSCRLQRSEKPIPPVKESEGQTNLEPLIAELQRQYKAAKSEQDRRAVCLRAIDEGAIRRGVPVSSVDQIFGTNFATQPPTSVDGVNVGVVHFVPEVDIPSPVTSDRKTEARGFIGWELAIDYDDSGALQKFYLSNLHKGSSSRTDEKEPVPISELRRRYEAAQSERERRDVAIQAIDEGVIQTFGPVNISTVDSIFGGDLASRLPTKKEVKRTGIVDFASSIPTTASGKDEVREPSGWFMAIDYYYDGNIENYYLTKGGQ